MSNTKSIRRPIHAAPDSLATRAAQMDRDYLDSHPDIGGYERAQLPGEFLATGERVPPHWHVRVIRLSGNAAARIPHDPAHGGQL
jgi:hypothetical protein